MKAALLPLMLAAMAISSAAHARPEQAWRELQRGGELGDEPQNGPAPAAPAMPQAPSSPVGRPAPAPRPAAPDHGAPATPRSPVGAAPRASRPVPPGIISRGSRYDHDTWNSRGSGTWGSSSRSRDHYWSHDYDRYRAQTFRYRNSRYYSTVRFRVGAYAWPRGYSYSRWYTGDLLPWSFFYDDRYHLDQYWSYRLYTPPAGCRWVRVGDDALLITRYDGRVLDVIYDVFW